MKMNVRAALKYQFGDLAKSSIGFFVTVLVLTLAFPMIKYVFNGEMTISFNGYGMIAAVYLFVVGIVAPRSYIRLNIQMGVSRKTCFVAQLISLLAVAVILAVAGELMMTLLQRIFPSDGDIIFIDIYQILYNDSQALSFGGHLGSIAFNASIFACMYICGMFLTLLFWRLNKLWTIVAAIGLVVVGNLLIGGVATAAGQSESGKLLQSYAVAAAENPLVIIGTLLIIGAIFIAIEWLLLSRANIRAAK